MPDGQLKPLTHHQPATKVENGRRGATSTIDFIARQWASPSVKEYQIEAADKIVKREDTSPSSSTDPKIKKVIIFYKDGSFEAYENDKS